MTRDLQTLPPEHVKIQGPAGVLGATLEQPAADPLGMVLHLHPHPMHGGNRRNNVVRHGALGSLAAGCVALRVDFRGVPGSEGRHDHGFGEVDDAEAAVQWMLQRFPDLPLFLWGFSFGSRVGLELCFRGGLPVEGYLAVAWPTAYYTWPEGSGWPDRMSFLAGSEDDFVDRTLMQPALDHGGEFEVVDGADHFFRGQLHLVREFTRNKLQAWLPAKPSPE
ncbi:MAG: hypothetical protein DWQ01_15070 [Planctomycetota bacterium]|nr:MAG: hypothetical protein DWQ01_15070 [Planctomycetota bacterium]